MARSRTSGVSPAVAVLAVCCAATLYGADQQTVTPQPASQTKGASAAVQIDVSYSTSTADATLTGLGLRVHWNSAKLTFGSTSNVLATALMGQQEPQDDTANLDGDAATDKIVLVSWADIGGNWPGQVTARLLTLNFTTSSSFSGTTTVRFTASSTAAGYAFAATPATVVASAPPPPTGPPISEAGGNLYFVPTCAHTKGKGSSNWVTDMVVHNPGTAEATVNLYFLKRDQDNSGVRGTTVSVAGSTSRKLDDVILATFGQASAGGALLVGSTTTLLVSSRTYNNAATGTFGQYVEGFHSSQAVSGTASVRLVQLSYSADATRGFRSNVGFVNATGASTPVKVTVYRSDGSQLGVKEYTLRPYGSMQETDIIGKLTGADVDDAYAVVSSTAAGARYFVYASVADNRTSDPMTVTPQVPFAVAASFLAEETGPAGIAAAVARKKLEATHRLPGNGQNPDQPVAVRFDPETMRAVEVPIAAGEADIGVAAAGTSTIFSDGFEGAFPGSWTAFRGENPPGTAATDAVWGKTTYRKSAGNTGLWCAAGGAQAASTAGNYRSYMHTWVTYGPFSLADATAAHATFTYWAKTEAEWTGSTGATWGDPFMWLISVDADASDGRDYFGFKTSGDSNGWQARDFDFSTVTGIAPLGKSQVWFALVFRSDVSDEFEGVYVDELVLSKTTGATCTTPAAPVLTAPGSVPSATSYTVTWTATSADNTYEIQEGTDAAFTGASSVAVTGTSRTFTHTATATTTYFYRVRAKILCGGSTYTSGWSATAQTAVTAAAGGGESLWIPGTAALLGSQGSNWKTDLEVHNPGPTQAQFSVALHKRGATTTSPPSTTLTLDPGRSIRYLNALQALFSFSGAATLRVTTAATDLIVTSRTFNDQPTGTYGQFVPGTWAQAGVPYGRSVRLIQLAQSVDPAQGFRANIGICNLTTLSISVEVKLYNGNGTLFGTKTYALRPYEAIQRDKIFTEVTTQAVDDGFAIVRTTTTGGLFMAFASVVDNRSNDPIFIPAR